MSADQENAQPVDGSNQNVKQTVQAMRGGWEGWRVWTAEDQERIDLNECTDARCMNVEVNVGYQGLDEDSFLSQSAEIGNDLRAAWKTKLDAEGKRSSGTSLRETVLGESDQAQSHQTQSDQTQSDQTQSDQTQSD
ncbi:MAG: hypothetical protein LC799_07795 [Actinobacteria bacterium]|nr:hypothetical protein [Actinomycetota bacterium]